MKNIILVCLLLFSTVLVYSQSFVQPGNKWVYSEGWWDGLGNGERDTVTYTALTDTLLGGKYYHRVRPAIEIYPEYFRVDSAGIWVYKSDCENEWLYYSFNSPVGFEYRVPVGNCDTLENFGVMQMEFDTTDLFLGSNMRLSTYLFVPEIGDGYRKTISHDFGFTRYRSSSINAMYYKDLIGCVINGVTYGVLSSSEEYSLQPGEFILEQNYPNPFNPETKIKFSISEPGVVKLTVFDQLGREVETLVNEYRNSGIHEITFNAGNLASGLYIYRLQAGNYTASRKMTILK